MLDIIFTLDYEIHGNGEGSPRDLMVEPTGRMLRCFEDYGARLTIMADVAEIGRFREYAAAAGEDRFYGAAIEEQLRGAVARGHDVQLHVHSSYLGARFEDGRWVQDWTQYDLARLGYTRLAEIIAGGRSYLEGLLKPVCPAYACVAFRAANWSMQPSADIIRALRAGGIRIDTSVFKWGSRAGLVRFDYSCAFSNIVPWPVAAHDVCAADPEGDLWEVPIYCENRRIWDFLSVMRLYRVWQGRAHPLAGPPPAPAVAAGLESREPRPAEAARRGGRAGRALKLLRGRHPLKMDFNQCSGRQLIRALHRIESQYAKFPHALPVVLIGHSKLFTPFNERELRKFLEHAAGRGRDLRFRNLRDLDPAAMRKAFERESSGVAV